MNKYLILIISLVLIIITFNLHKTQRDIKQNILAKTNELNKLDTIEPVSEDLLLKTETSYLWGLSKYKNEKNLNIFSQSIKEELLKNNLDIIRYQRQFEDEQEFIEFTIEGRPIAFFNFLSSFTSKAQAFKLPHFSLNVENDSCRIIFLIGFDVINEKLKNDIPLTEDYQWSEDIDLARRSDSKVLEYMFYREPKKIIVTKPVAVVEPIIEKPQKSPRMKFQYIGKVSINDTQKYYVKETIQDKLYTIPSEDFIITNTNQETLYFEYKNNTYEVDLK